MSDREERPSSQRPQAESRRYSDITPQEIQEALFDAGYVGDTRKDWVKCVLTGLGVDPADEDSPERQELAERVKEVVDRNQSRRPMSDDTL